MSNTISGVSATTQQYTDYSSLTSKQADWKRCAGKERCIWSILLMETVV